MTGSSFAFPRMFVWLCVVAVLTGVTPCTGAELGERPPPPERRIDDGGVHDPVDGGGTDGGGSDGGDPWDGGFVEGAEAACSMLGAACTCSEPLTGSSAFASGFKNPADSPSDSECAGGNAVYSSGGSAGVAAFEMPAGSSVNTVWRIDYPGGVSHTYGDNNFTLDQGTVCTRLYQRFSSDYPLMGDSGDPANERNKMMEMSGSWGQFQSEMWPPNRSAVFSPRGNIGEVGYDARLSHSGDEITVTDCKNHWCRLEQCTDRAGSTVTFRTRVEAVGSGKVSHHTSGPIRGVSPLYLEAMWIGNLYRETVYSGSRFISHAMQASWSTTSGQWIGPACEVEGTTNWGACP